ncbi:hypothetical protein PHYSODRAFT_525756 [Phytophthora sojae]|uniref:Uncharacterized protein n=1 Tax=Phytophthora sojae (strain P6497) TaxID=1094619 RepID=G5A651_PHYSP|nr:hypothetical protein PHYSODRAFT_525756 [Phytophthora sojae]EGZ08806.1 hypothetical protein PHYSODRAFT_525756 [Phytophthora sojae]|eukprot:XP_009535439.1 hypothetical protein PHYSODRAFT_525756 [Phytophthora sojae]
MWKASKYASFYEFCRRNGHVHNIGASPSANGKCAVVAVEIAVTFLGNSGWAPPPPGCFGAFVEYCDRRGRPLSPDGLTARELHFYIKYLNDRCGSSKTSQISIRVFDGNLLGGVNGKNASEVLMKGALVDGVYVCAAYSSLRVTHCFAIKVFNCDKLIYNDNNVAVEIQAYDAEWIMGIIFLRRIALYLP